MLTNKRLIFQSCQKPPICPQQKTGTFICDKFMFINIDKLLALELLTFSLTKVGLQAVMFDQALICWLPIPDQLNMTRANTHNRERSENQCRVTRGDTRDSHYGQQDTVLCIMDRVPGTSGIPREKLIVISDWVVSCAECQYRPIRGLTTQSFNQSEV